LLALGPKGESLIAGAVRRGRLVAEDVVIVTAEEQAAATREVMPGVRLIAEPFGRNTAAAIALAAATLAASDPEAVLVVLPADQHVADEAGLARALAQLCDAAEQTGSIGVVGLTPTRAETGFGYLEVGAGAAPTPVTRFCEKPDRETAERFVASGNYLWNAGIFVATAKRLLAELEARLPATAAAARAIAAGGDARALYEPLTKISIDHAVMEKAANVVAVPASIGWDDVGSWAALPAVHGTGADGNTIVGDAIVLGGSGNIVMTDDHTVIATVGVSDLVIVKAGDAILVIRKDAAQDVRQAVDALAARGLGRVL
jgi:mannose-1-phosphate guanylyltransferase